MTQLFTGGRRARAGHRDRGCPARWSPCAARPRTGTTPFSSAYEEVPAKRLNKLETGHLAKVGVAPHRHLREFHGTTELTVGENVTVDVFGPGDHIKVTGTSIGKGFAGTIKRHNFGRGPESHGSHNVRKPGSIGQSAQPSRVFKGVRMSGHMGDERVTQRGLVVIDRDSERNVILVSAPCRAPRAGLVEIREDAH